MAKTREEWVQWFTVNDEIDGYEVGDDTAEFRGYIECVEGTQMVRTKYCEQTELFKFYANNAKGRRIKVLLWGASAVKWSPKISERSIVTLERAVVHSPNNRWKGGLEPNCTTELKIVMKSSNIVIEPEKFIFAEGADTPNKPLPETTLIQDLMGTKHKRLRVYGWIKVPFELTTFGGGSRGSGVIVDHQWRVRVHVRIFQSKANLVKGTRVYVDCEFNAQDGSVLSCQSMDDIVPVPDEKVLAVEELNAMGFFNPKRKAEDVLITPPTKRSPFDI